MTGLVGFNILQQLLTLLHSVLESARFSIIKNEVKMLFWIIHFAVTYFISRNFISENSGALKKLAVIALVSIAGTIVTFSFLVFILDYLSVLSKNSSELLRSFVFCLAGAVFGSIMGVRSKMKPKKSKVVPTKTTVSKLEQPQDSVSAPSNSLYVYQYMIKYNVTEKKVHAAVKEGKLKAYYEGETLWVEDKNCLGLLRRPIFRNTRN